MSLDYRRIAMWTSGVSCALLLVAIATAGNAMDAMRPMLDPEQENVMRLDPGESGGAELIDSHYYVALRIVTDGEDPDADLRLVSGNGENEIEGDAPGSLHVDRQLDAEGPIYRPVRVFIVPESGDYTLHNEGDSDLWLVDDLANEMQVFTDPTVLVMFGSCCLGLIVGLVAIVFAILTLRNRSPEQKKISGIVIDGRVMTTDEVYRAHQEGESQSAEQSVQVIHSAGESVPDPFIDSTKSTPSAIPDTQPVKSPESANDTSAADGEKWRSWDEG